MRSDCSCQFRDLFSCCGYVKTVQFKTTHIWSGFLIFEWQMTVNQMKIMQFRSGGAFMPNSATSLASSSLRTACEIFLWRHACTGFVLNVQNLRKTINITEKKHLLEKETILSSNTPGHGPFSEWVRDSRVVRTNRFTGNENAATGYVYFSPFLQSQFNAPAGATKKEISHITALTVILGSPQQKALKFINEWYRLGYKHFLNVIQILIWRRAEINLKKGLIYNRDTLFSIATFNGKKDFEILNISTEIYRWELNVKPSEYVGSQFALRNIVLNFKRWVHRIPWYWPPQKHPKLFFK